MNLFFTIKNGHNGYDHAVYASARLMKPDYDPSIEDKVPFHTLAEYDRLLSASSIETNLRDNVHMLYEWVLVNRVDYGTLRRLYNDERSNEAIEFLRTNKKDLLTLLKAAP